jgi:hypothetical protein
VSSPLRIVASPTDLLASALENLAQETGRNVERLTHIEAALNTSIEVRAEGTHVAPDSPMFLRPPLEPVPTCPDLLFLQAERIAHLWAAATLSRCPVVNRPTPGGLWGRVTSSSRITEQRAGLNSDRTEVFCTDSDRRDWAGSWAAARYNGSVSRWPDELPGPVRARPIREAEEYEAVLVVGSAAWRLSDAPLSHLSLPERSVAAAQTLGLNFSVVWWAVPPEMDHAIPARIKPVPSFPDVAPHWPVAGIALLNLLRC